MALHILADHHNVVGGGLCLTACKHLLPIIIQNLVGKWPIVKVILILSVYTHESLFIRELFIEKCYSQQHYSVTKMSLFTIFILFTPILPMKVRQWRPISEAIYRMEDNHLTEYVEEWNPFHLTRMRLDYFQLKDFVNYE